ncbi:hypothetical protein Cgig2_012536 [Carnegiea gigantea]|uniref:Uncharacterized protein n=1 Tax=Carnegiea gigantea TaxID=171969 RepID=A0A9Q1JIN8_9CARY|nr:hypothetical protein Cgig2_012536 [Carnegiea gigantea]
MGKCKMGNLYTSRRQSRKVTTHKSEEQAAEEIEQGGHENMSALLGTFKSDDERSIVRDNDSVPTVDGEGENMTALLGMLETSLSCWLVKVYPLLHCEGIPRNMYFSYTVILISSLLQGGDKEISALEEAMVSSGQMSRVGERESTAILEAAKPPVPEVRFIPILVHFNYMWGGDDKISALLGVLENGGPLLSVGEIESAPVVEAGEAPLIPKGGDISTSTLLKTSALLNMLKTASYPSSVGKSLPAIDAREPSIPQGEYHTIHASLLAKNTGTTYSSEGKTALPVDTREPPIPQPRDEKTRAIVRVADTGGSPTAGAVGSLSVAGGQPPIRQAPSAIARQMWKATVRRGQPTSPSYPSNLKDAPMAIQNYLLRSMCTKDVELLCAMWRRCKSSKKVTDWIVELNKGGVQHISAFHVKGLVKVLPRGDLGDKAGEYCINGFAIDHYGVNALIRRPYTPLAAYGDVGTQASPHEGGHLNWYSYIGGHSLAMPIAHQVYEVHTVL